MKIAVLIPTYNDWGSLGILLKNIKTVRGQFTEKVDFEIIVVDDCSTQPIDLMKTDMPVTVLELNQNMGHQRAIALGLCHCNENFNGDAVVVMDADGEDNPVYIANFIEKMKKEGQIVFAKRNKRQEGFLFKLFYGIYKLVFALLTGESISFGNFSIIPKAYLNRIIYLPEIWNHYSGAIIKSRLPYTTISSNRGKRYRGKSKMNFSSLIVHGFSSLSVYAEIISVRIIFFTFITFVINLGIGGVVLYRKFISQIASPGWATTSILGLGIVSLMLLMFSFMTGLLVLYTRNQGLLNNSSREYKKYINNVYEH